MQRIAVIGNAGRGKSTLCIQLGQALNIPVYMIDKIQWKPGWIQESSDIVVQKHELFIINAGLLDHRWLGTLGGYRSTFSGS